MDKSTLQHAPIDQFKTRNHNLVIGNIDLLQLAARVGETPFYAYDRNLISERMASLRNDMPKELKIHYAMKANPMPAVVQHMTSICDGFDVASAGEMNLALDTTMPKQNISLAGPGKRPDELKRAVAAGITINVESPNELEILAKKSEQLGLAAHVAIRINPAFELKSSGMKMGGGAKPFGIDEEQIPNILHRIRSLNLNFQGFHIYAGSQILKPESIIEAQKKSIDLAIRLSELCPSPIQKLNIGGGYGIPYFPGDTRLDTKQIGDALEKKFSEARDKIPTTNIIIELGRYLIGEAGIYVTKIIDKKKSRGQLFLICDGGLNHNLAASGNFGQIIRKNYPVTIGNKLGIKQQETVNIVGPLCTPLDLLADRMKLPKAEIGDLVVIFQSGAYGFSASPNAFLTQPNISEVLV